MNKELINLVDISKAFDGETVLDELNLNIHENEFLTLLGPSGCGKTTTLRILGGFVTPDKDALFSTAKILQIFRRTNASSIPYSKNMHYSRI